ncbi:MAG TPA: hypothetical protein VGH13_20495 [Xanthobacteraceae bacterium]
MRSFIDFKGGNSMIGKCCVVAALLFAGAAAAKTSTTLDVPIVVTHGTGLPCTGKQVITDASTYAVGAPITVTTCGGAGNPLDWVTISGEAYGLGGGYLGKYAKYLGVNTSGATVTLLYPQANFDRDLVSHIDWFSNDTYSWIASSAPFIIQKSINPAAPLATLPVSEAADPFVPDHVITVCSTGCTYTSLGDATQSAYEAGWDNVQIKISSGEYQYPALTLGGSYPPNLWIKGIGTTMPHIWGTTTTSGSIIGSTNGYASGSLTVDNLDLGPWNGWIMNTKDGRTVTLRNDYIRDGAQGYITGNTVDFTANFYNVVFARNGGGNGPEHNVYIGEGNNGNVVNVKNSVFEQPITGHAFKERAKFFNASCSMFIVNEDDVFMGSETIDMDSGQPNLTNNLSVNSGGSGATNSNQNSWDSMRFAVDYETGQSLKQPIVKNNIFLADQADSRHWFFTFGERITSPPAVFSDNKWVWHDAGTRAAGVDGSDATGALYVLHSGVITDIQLDGTNSFFNDRASAGFPAIGSFPKGWRDYLPLMPAACKDPIGLVAVPPS